ncbi:hypothetical protein [uncultured Prevotella sp.]|uniref:hypothetical protein n=1 Tax=uncultured Prevotella sp. TaxID=159272 RepID=UPI00344D071F
MTKWEYSRVFINSEQEDGIDVLNRHGYDGWELVSVIEQYSGCYACYFKRPM